MDTEENPPLARALLRFGMNSPDASRLTNFYEQAFDAQVQSRQRRNQDYFARWAAVRGGANCTVLSLGDAAIEILQFDHPGRPYPHGLSPYDTRFQHLGIVVSDMEGAMQRLSQTEGWSAISAGAQVLPAGSGGVTAFKFRDPDGHPLEFLQFAAGNVPAHWHGRPSHGLCRGIDHSALSVTDVDRSVRFYRSLGLHLSQQTLNQGVEQERLDGVSAPVVDVISLAPRRSTPHVELLHYRTATRTPHDMPAGNDAAATRLIFALQQPGAAAEHLIQDPDGHFIQFE